MDATENPVEDGIGGARRRWGPSGMATLIPTPKPAPSYMTPLPAHSPEGRPIVGPTQNDLVVSDAVTEDIFPNRTGTVLAEHQRSRLEAAAAADIEATTSGSTSLPTLDLTGSDAAASANSSRVLSADTSCWNLSQEISQHIGSAPKSPEDARTIEHQEADEALEAEAAELVSS